MHGFKVRHDPRRRAAPRRGDLEVGLGQCETKTTRAWILPWRSARPTGSADLKIRVTDSIVLADVRQVSVKMKDPVAAPAASRPGPQPSPYWLSGTATSSPSTKNFDQQVAGVIKPYTISTDSGRTSSKNNHEGGTAFGRVGA